MRPVLFTAPDGHSCLADAEKIVRAYWTENYGPDARTRVVLCEGQDLVVQESVEKVLEIVKEALA